MTYGSQHVRCVPYVCGKQRYRTVPYPPRARTQQRTPPPPPAPPAGRSSVHEGRAAFHREQQRALPLPQQQQRDKRRQHVLPPTTRSRAPPPQRLHAISRRLPSPAVAAALVPSYRNDTAVRAVASARGLSCDGQTGLSCPLGSSLTAKHAGSISFYVSMNCVGEAHAASAHYALRILVALCTPAQAGGKLFERCEMKIILSQFRSVIRVKRGVCFVCCRHGYHKFALPVRLTTAASLTPLVWTREGTTLTQHAP